MDSLTIHGLPRIFLSKRTLSKVFWTTVFVLACVLLVLFLHSRVLTFKKRDVILKTERSVTSTMNFPSLTLCDTDFIYDEKDVGMTEFPSSCANLSRSNNTSDLFRRGCSLFMPGVLFSCTYDVASTCNFPKHFSPLNHHYKCYTFNKDGSLLQKISDRVAAIDMMLFKNSTEPISAAESHWNPLRETNRGIMLSLHSPDRPISFSQGSAIPLTPGYQIHVNLKKVVFRRLPAPFPSKCASTSSYKLLISGAYQRKNCVFSCINNLIYENCGKVDESGRPFMPEKDYPTTKNLTKNQYDCCRLSQMIGGIAKCKCPIECDDVVYKPRVTQTPWRQSSLNSKMKRALAKTFNLKKSQVNLDFLKQNIIHLTVYFDDFTTERISEQPQYTIESLMCDFGGLMGLLIGASTISMFEIVCICVQMLLNKKAKRTGSIETTEDELQHRK